MLSIVFDTSFFVDLLQYILNTSESEAKDIGKTFVDIYYAEKSENPGINTPVSKVCINIISSIIADEFDLEDESSLAAVELKLKDSKAVQKDPTKFEPLLKILTGKKLTQKKMMLLEKQIGDRLKWYNSFKPIKKQLAASQKFITSNDEAKRTLALLDIEKGANDALRALDTSIKKVKFLEYINFKDLSQIERALELNKLRKHESMFKTGLKGLNRILGDIGGITCGDFMLIIALSGHHKTASLMNYARWTCLLNDPWKQRSGIPSIVYFSLENDINSNTEQWYYSTYCNLFNSPPENKTVSQMAKMIHEEFNRRGFEFHVFREPANGFTFNDYKSRCNGLIEKGCDIQLCLFDYLTLMSPDKSVNSNSAQEIVNMSKDIRDYGKRNGFATIAGAQAAEANWAMTVGKGIHPAKRCTAGVIGEAKGIYQIADVVVYQYIEKNHREHPYLTMFCGKYRDFSPTSEYNPFVAYKFQKYGIMDDLYGDDMSVTDIYADGMNCDDKMEDTVDLF